MSKRTNSAPSHRAQIKVLAKQPSQEAAPRKTIVSALSVLVGTGVVTLAFGSPEAHAKSAVDELDWVSQSQQALMAQRSQQAQQAAASVNSSSAADMTAARVAEIEPAELPMAAAHPLTIKAPAPLSGVADVRPEKGATSQREQGFSAAGLTTRPQLELIPAAVSTPRPVLASTLTVDGSYATRPSIVPTVASRMPNIKADLQSLRGSLATGATTRIDDEALAAPSSASSSSMARHDAAGLQASLQVSQNAGGQARNAYLAGAGNSSAMSRRAQRNAGSLNRGYSEWLDDGAGSSARANTAVVPEQAVRAALPTDAAAARSATVRQAQTGLEASRADIDQVKGQRYPQVQLGGNTPSITGDSASFNQYNRPTASVGP